MCLTMMAFSPGCGNNAGHHDHSHEAHTHEDHSEELHDHVHDLGDIHAESNAGEHGSGEIVFEAAKAIEAGVESDTVKAGTFRDVIRTGGKIIPATGNETAVVANISGIISFSSPLAEGSGVNENETLFTISSDNLQDGDPAKKAYIAYETARKEYERAKALVEDNIVSRQEFETIKSNYHTARLAYEAIGGGENGGTAVKAPVKGHAARIAVKDGDFVSVGQPLLTIVRYDRMYLQADLSGKYIDRMDGIVSANFTLPFSDRLYRLDELGGKILAKGRMLDGNTAYIPVTFEFKGNSGIMPGTFAEVYLLSQERDGVISLPETALIEEQGEYYAYRKLDADCYEKIHVIPGASDGERIEILSGITEGDVIVTKGAMRIKLASAANTIPGHTHNH